MGDRHDDAVAALYSPLHQARTPEALKQSALRRTKTVDDMREYMRRIQLSPDALPANVVHITGTKGKGSTACMCESILRERYQLNTGLFTSPHLVDIRERIRVGGKPISKAVFAEAYWQVRQRLEEYKDTNDDLPALPGYFRMMALMALYVFSHYEPPIDVVILEVGMGGRYDATNILDTDQRNVVCGVTLLDFDHTRVLGDTIEKIAWEKGGIFQVKKGSTHVSKRPSDGTYEPSGMATVTKVSEKRLFALDTNTESAISVLRTCAAIEGQGQMLYLVSEGQSLPATISLGLQGDHQRINAELSVALSEALIKSMLIAPERDRGSSAMHLALENASWPGRCQSVELKAVDGTPLNLRLDGAHTPKSIEACLKWFLSVSGGESENVNRVLIFNCSHERSPVALLEQLASCRPQFAAIYFCRADFERPSMVGKSTARELLEKSGITFEENMEREGEASTWQDTLAEVWRSLETMASTDGQEVAPAKITVNLNMRDAIDEIQRSTGHERLEVLVTGSLYIVGSALDAVRWTEEVAFGSLAWKSN